YSTTRLAPINYETQAAAAWAMGRRAGPADPADRPALLGVVRQSDEPLPVSAALVALGAHQGEEVLDLLAEVLLKRSAAEALPVWKRLDKRDRAGLLFLREAIKRQDGRRPPTRRDKIPPRGPGRLIFGEERIYIARLRAAAAIGLGRIGDRRAVQPLVLALMEEEGRYNDLPRGFSAIALGEIGDPRGRKPLLVTLARTRDEDDEVRGFAAIGLGLHVRASAAAEPGEQALNLLASRLLDEREDDEVRAGCALALGLTGSTQTLRHLRSAMQRLDENDLEIAGYVLLARAMLGDPEILPVAERVLELTGDERRISDRLARRTTILALGVLGSAEAVPTLSALWESDEDFRRHATRALVTAGRAEAGRLVLDAVRRTDDSDDLAGYLRLLGEVFAERPNALARLTADTNFTMPHNELRDYQELASEFLYDELIPALGEKWR
ncbi:MAG: HEAT repeat domain-containing protein, partial [Phycisphaeraceae bacterium]